MAKQTTKIWKLDSLRGLAAFYVFLCHSRLKNAPRFGVIFHFGPESVMLFFILSGFVIYYATCRSGKTITFRKYFASRFGRIYPLFLLALALSCLVPILRGPPRQQTLSMLVGNLLMFQDMQFLKPGVWIDTYAGNFPLWSLSYEWWFYMMFWVVAFSTKLSAEKQRYAVFVLSIAGCASYQLWPNQLGLFLGYFFIWWCGVDLAREYLRTDRLSWNQQFKNILLLGVLTAAWGLPVFVAHARGLLLRPGYSPVLQFRHLLAAWIFLVSGILWYQLKFVGFNATLGVFRLLAPISYASYIFHELLLRSQLFEPVRNDWVRLVLYILALWAICYLLEVQLQPILNKLVQRIFLGRKDDRQGSDGQNVSSGVPPAGSFVETGSATK